MRTRLVSLGTYVPLVLAAQGPTAEKSQILTSATAEIAFRTDRATLVLSIENSPEITYPGENKPPRVTSHVARNSVGVEERNIDLTGP